MSFYQSMAVVGNPAKHFICRSDYYWGTSTMIIWDGAVYSPLPLDKETVQAKQSLDNFLKRGSFGLVGLRSFDLPVKWAVWSHFWITQGSNTKTNFLKRHSRGLIGMLLALCSSKNCWRANTQRLSLAVYGLRCYYRDQSCQTWCVLFI